MDFNRQNVSIKHVTLPIDGILCHLFKILSCNRAIFMLLDSNMRLNIDIKVIVKKWLVLINVHGSIFVQTGYVDIKY